MNTIPSYKEKANQSLLSAKYLIEKKAYSNSVHCAFYSCLQTMFHVLFNKKKIDQNKFVIDGKYNRTGSHLQAFKLIETEIANKYPTDSKWFKNYFFQLKRLREKADYTNEFIKQEEVYEAINKANSISSIINKI